MAACADAAAGQHTVAVHVLIDRDVPEPERHRRVNGVEERLKRVAIGVVTRVRQVITVVDRLPRNAVLHQGLHRRNPHSPAFDFDEEALKGGAAFFDEVAREAIKTYAKNP